MIDDFPAAHSMDTMWFAVDANGNVGLFDSGEDGAVPARAATLGHVTEPSFDATVFYDALRARRIAAGAMDEAIDDQYDELYTFGRDHGDDPGKYQRATEPAAPLRIDELPEVAREAIGALRLPVSFSASADLHLGDHLADADAFYYGEDWTLRGFGSDDGSPSAPPTARALGKSERRRALGTVVAIIIGLAVIAIAVAR